jgi:hypothetical protein
MNPGEGLNLLQIRDGNPEGHGAVHSILTTWKGLKSIFT